MSKKNIQKEKELILVMLEQLSYIIRYVNNAIYYGSTISMVASYLVENLIHHDSEEPCEIEPEEIKDIFNSFKDTEIQLKKMHSTVNIISEILWDFDNTFNDLMTTTGIYYTKTDYFDELLTDYKNYSTQKTGDLKMNKKGECCMLAFDKICDYCGDCEECGLLDITDKEEMIEDKLYQSERESDLM